MMWSLPLLKLGAVMPLVAVALECSALSFSGSTCSKSLLPLHLGKLSQPTSRRATIWKTRKPRRSSTSLQQSNGSSSSSYDLSKPTFDLYSLRSRRGDALLQYASTNQSEPLRINLYALLALSLFAFPSISESVVGEPLTLPAAIGCKLGGAAGVGLFVRECARRSRQLDRLERELNAEVLGVRLPDGVGGVRRTPTSLGDLRGERRVLCVAGNAAALRGALVDLRVVRNRLRQARVVCVAVPTDGSRREDWVGDRDAASSSAAAAALSWLAEPHDVPSWLAYIRDLTSATTEGDQEELPGDELLWFGLTYRGRSFGSGLGGDSPLRVLELLGSYLQPVDALGEGDASEVLPVDDSAADELAVLEAQKQFYAALTSGNVEGMVEICSSNVNAEEVSEVIQNGGRIDDWESCLADGARPTGMKISGCDVVLASKDVAYSTCVEFPASSVGTDSATLLAVQRWERATDNDRGNDAGVASMWRLVLHQTIPWSPGERAGGTLRCDRRGCVALTRSSPSQRRTFGGVIG